MNQAASQAKPAIDRPLAKAAVALFLILPLLSGSPATAHHSFAMFDRTSETTSEGVVKEWQFTNPHAYLQVMVRRNEAPAELSLETFSVSSLLQRGLRRDSYKPGDKITVVYHPLRNGAPGGELVAVTTADGKTMKFMGG